jgi:oligopeptide transport system ATP-binding protein
VRHISDRIAVMYLGHVVELAGASEIYERPLHPYTRALISAVPVPDPVRARENQRIPMTGEIPSPLNAPSGCPFHTRCPYAKDSCKEGMPELREIEKGRFVACHRIEEIG